MTKIYDKRSSMIQEQNKIKNVNNIKEICEGKGNNV
jgi:hypothetical protein